ncbi:MAG: hypothetical protein HQL52_05435 [Magnetococcales bacterium]|nr:hypothetical protein [Magnetococcales bacterium]
MYFTLTAMMLYLVSDWILNRIEESRGARFEYRSMIFFGIILSLSMIVFQGVQRFFPG